MSTLFALKDKIKEGFKIRRKCWKSLTAYIRYSSSAGKFTDDENPAYTHIFGADEMFADDWELYVEPVDYNACIGCVGLFSDTKDFKSGRLDILVQRNANLTFKAKFSGHWAYFKPVKPEDLIFYKEN